MKKIYILEKGENFLLPILIAVAGTYSYPLISILMPACAFLLLWQSGWKFSFHRYTPFVFLLLLLMLGGVGVFWAKYPPEALSIFITVSLTTAFAYVFISLAQELTLEQCAKYWFIFAKALFFIFFIVLFQYTLEEEKIKLFNKLGAGYMMKPTASILGLSAFMGCALLWAYNKKIVSGLTFILVFLLIYITRNDTAYYGIVLATGAFIISYVAPFWITRIALISSYTCLISTPFIFIHLDPFVKMPWILAHTTFLHRILSWAFLSRKFFENPWFGWGLGSTPYLPEGPEIIPGFKHLIHPHKGSLQIYVELGIGGGGVVCSFLCLFIFDGRKIP